jgi:hypothetical protein
MSALNRLWDVEQATLAANLDLDEEGGDQLFFKDGEFVEPDADDLREWELGRERAAKRLQEPGPGRRRLDDRHRSEEVADIYLRAARGPGRTTPTKAVAEVLNVSHSTAAKWVAIAIRKYGLLPATTAGKPSDPYKEPATSTPAKRPATRTRKGSAR